MTGHNRFYTKAEMENVMKEALAGYAELETKLQAANARADAAEAKLLKARKLLYELIAMVAPNRLAELENRP